MKVWSAIFNLIAVVIIAIMLIVINNIENTNRRQFEELRLAQAVDYAVEAAFRSAVSADSVGTDYANNELNNIHLNHSKVLETFSNVLCLSYDMSSSEENLKKIEDCIPTAALCAIDGYYILEEVEKDDDTESPEGKKVVGEDYGLLWGPKRPYLLTCDNIVFAVNLVTEDLTGVWKTVDGGGGIMALDSFANPEDVNTQLGTLDGIAIPTDEEFRRLKRQAISQCITEDMNYAIHTRNVQRTKNKLNAFYMPSSSGAQTTINSIESPSLLLLFQDSTFLNGYDIDVVSVSGYRVKMRSFIIGFTQNGVKYYCYAGQQKDKNGNYVNVNVDRKFDSFQEAAEAGYNPHYQFLANGTQTKYTGDDE